MKSDIDIKDDIYACLKKSRLANEITGKIYKIDKRDTLSQGEDVLITIAANQNGQMQECIAYVNIYVADDYKDSSCQYIEATIRLRELCKVSSEVLEVGRGDGFRFTLDSQRVIETQTKEHIISNKLIYKQLNEDSHEHFLG